MFGQYISSVSLADARLWGAVNRLESHLHQLAATPGWIGASRTREMNEGPRHRSVRFERANTSRGGVSLGLGRKRKDEEPDLHTALAAPSLRRIIAEVREGDGAYETVQGLARYHAPQACLLGKPGRAGRASRMPRNHPGGARLVRELPIKGVRFII